MECVSSIPLATCLAGPQNATQEYGIGSGQNPWTFNSSHAAFWDCMSQWSFGKGTATSHGHHFFVESPPISPRSRPTKVAIPVPELSLEEEMDDSVTNVNLCETADSLEENELVLNDEKLSEPQGSLFSSPGIRTPGALQANRFAVENEHHKDVLEASLPALRRAGSSSSQRSDSDDNAASRRSLEEAAPQIESTEASQERPVPSELDTIVHELGESNRHIHSIARLVSLQRYRSSTPTAGSWRESAGDQWNVPANENDFRAMRDAGTEVNAGEPTDGPTSRSDDNPRHLAKYRLKENLTGSQRLAKDTRRNDASTPKHERRMRAEKRRAKFGKRRARLHNAGSGITANQASGPDQPDSEDGLYVEHKSCSISGPVTTTEANGSLVSECPAAIPHGQLASDAGLLPGETSAASLSSYEEAETDVSDIEQPHPLDSLRDEIVSLFLQRCISYRTETQQQLEDTSSRGNNNDSVSKTSGGQPQSKERGAKQGSSQKRKRNSDSQDDDSIEDDDEADPRKQKRPPKGTMEESTKHRSFACPFSKKSPSKHRRCYRYDLKRIRDVKQHLRRCHRKGVYCPVCSQTFDSEEARDAHVRQRSCAEKPGFIVEGLSEAQAQSLSGKCSTKVVVEEQWFRVFDICFPGHPRPKSPYVDRNLSEELQSFRDFASTEGPSIIRERMQGFRELNEQDNAFLCRVLSDGLELIAHQWSQGQDSESTPELTTAPAATVPHSSRESSSAGQSTPPQVSELARDVRGDPPGCSLGNMQDQLLGILSGDESQHGVGTTEAENSIYGFGAELFDFDMLSTGPLVVTAPGDVNYHTDIWTLRYGPNVELAT